MPAQTEGTVKTQREVAKAMNLSPHAVATLEEKALSKAHTVLTMTPDNTHLIAHKPTIKEIDDAFKTLPWCKFIQFSTRNTTKVISRREWRKSFLPGDFDYEVNGTYNVT